MTYSSWEKRPPRKFRGKPQWTLDDVYISPFTARRRYDEEGVMHYDEVERRLYPTGMSGPDFRMAYQLRLAPLLDQQRR